MSFDYDKLRDKQEEANWWASYSDMWSMLAIVFLMLFVGTSLRTGTQGIQQYLEQEELQKKNAELQEQLRVYNNLRDESLQQVSQQEQEVYEKLMSKLELLQEEAKDEKNELRRQAKENEEKEFALNQYQQVVKNIINANLLSKTQIVRRDLTIDEKRQTIAEKQQEIQELDRQVQQKERTIASNEAKIEEIDSKLEQQIKKLEQQQKQAKLSKQAMNQAVEKLKKDSEKRVQALQTENQKVRTQMASELEQAKESYAEQLAEMREQNAEQLKQERDAFESNLQKQRLSAAAKAQKLAAFQKQAEAKAKELESQLGGLSGKVKETEQQLAQAKAEQGKLAAQARDLAQQKDALGSELKTAQERLNARKNLVDQIKKNFANAGIKAQVDGGTGDVVIDFGEEYFDTGSAQLKEAMVKTLNKLIPAYSKSLFQDPKTAEKISNVEIIGFASSTYKGKYVNPKSLKSDNQEAINYNLRLSFNRANSIFRHIFDPTKLSYENQKKLLPMVKVVGRGFLPEGVTEKDLPEDMPEKEFCAKFNCKKSQRVMVRFNLKE